MRMARELGRPVKFDGGAGLFVCVDGFGPTSPEERAAGLPGHGEAHTETFAIRSERQGSSTAVTLTAKLPIVQELFTRTFRVNDGENVVYVDSELENLLGFEGPSIGLNMRRSGRPFSNPALPSWTFPAHARRLGPIHLTVETADVQRRLASGQNFTWPIAPGLDGKS